MLGLLPKEERSSSRGSDDRQTQGWKAAPASVRDGPGTKVRAP